VWRWQAAALSGLPVAMKYAYLIRYWQTVQSDGLLVPHDHHDASAGVPSASSGSSIEGVESV